MLRTFDFTRVSELFNTLSQEERGGGGSVATPFLIFPRAACAFSHRLSFGRFTTFCPDTHVSLKKKFQKALPWKSWGVGGRGARGLHQRQQSLPEREGVAAQINKFS